MKSIRLVMWVWLIAACSKTNPPEAGSETHFLHTCGGSCAAPYQCLCGVCTLPCEGAGVCGEQAAEATCLAPSGAASCDGALQKVCDVECRSDRECRALGSDYTCESGRCRGPNVESDGGATPDGSTPDPSRPDAGDMSLDADTADSSMPDAGPSEPLCDGSDEIRLAVNNLGGFVQVTTYFTNPFGHRFLVVDGKCHYYAGIRYMQGVVQGDLNAEQARQLEQAVHWADRAALSGRRPANSCADASTSTVAMQDAAFACECDCGSGEARSEAIAQALQAIQPLFDQGTKLTGSVSALAHSGSDGSGTMRAWPLDRAVAGIPGLVQSGGDFSASGALFDAAADASALRQLRADELNANPNANFVLVDSQGLYSVYVRDELPTVDAQAVRAFLDQAKSRL